MDRVFLRNGTNDRREIMTAESASRPITVRHFTGSEACHIINYINCVSSKIFGNVVVLYTCPFRQAAIVINHWCLHW
jgi:hypothetical protein